MPIDIQLNIKVETKSLSIRQQDMSYISASSIILKSTFRYHRTSSSLIKTAQLQRDRTIPWNKFFPKQCCSITATQISAVVATVKRRTDREGGGRKIGEKIQRGEKKKKCGTEWYSLASGPPETDIGAVAVDLHLFDALCQRFCTLQWKFPSTLLFTPFSTLFVHFTIVIEFFSIIPSDHLHMFPHCLLYMIQDILCRWNKRGNIASHTK